MLAADLLRYLEVRGAVIPNLRTVPMPTALWKVPFTNAAGKASRFVETTASPTTPVDYGAGAAYAGDAMPDGRTTFDAERFRGKMITSREYIEESIVPIMPFMIQDAADQLRRAIEDCIINGDTESPWIDSDLNGTVTALNIMNNRTAWDGWRDNAAANDGASDTVQPVTANHVTVTNANSIRTSLRRYGIDPNQLMWVCGIKSYLDLLDLPEFLTMEKVGNKATILTGQMGDFFGIPIVVSEFVREDLAASGVRVATTTSTQTTQILVHRPSWWLGNWRGVTTEPERIPARNVDVVWAWWSGDFQVMTTATEPTVGVLVDID
jgi:hypothetical protein